MSEYDWEFEREGMADDLAEAQEAAETYHAAWQDAAVYWKEKVERLEGEVRAWRRRAENLFGS